MWRTINTSICALPLLIATILAGPWRALDIAGRLLLALDAPAMFNTSIDWLAAHPELATNYGPWFLIAISVLGVSAVNRDLIQIWFFGNRAISPVAPSHTSAISKSVADIQGVLSPNSNQQRIGIITASGWGPLNDLTVHNGKVCCALSLALSNLGNTPLSGCCLYLESIRPNTPGIGETRLTEPNIAIGVGENLPVTIIYAYIDNATDMVYEAAINNPSMPEYGYNAIRIPLGNYDISLKAIARGAPESMVTIRAHIVSDQHEVRIERLER